MSICGLVRRWETEPLERCKPSTQRRPAWTKTLNVTSRETVPRGPINGTAPAGSSLSRYPRSSRATASSSHLLWENVRGDTAGLLGLWPGPEPADADDRAPALGYRAALRAAGLHRGEGMRQTVHERAVQHRHWQLCVLPRLGWGPMPALRREIQVQWTHGQNKAAFITELARVCGLRLLCLVPNVS